MKISICALTLRRPDGLRRLLAALDALEFDDPQPAVDVIVVDNDPDRSAASICEEIRGGFRWGLRYEIEARRGVAHARNRALELVAPDSDQVAFVDDDEVPESRWLAEILKVQERTGADVVAGPVLPHFPTPVAAWVEAGEFFQPHRPPDGSVIPYAFTGNVLFRASLLADPRLKPAFAERYALSGGEDRHFFERVRRAGYTLHWADAAVVREWVPASRATARWLVRRQLRVGNVTADIEAELDPGWRPAVARFARTGHRLLRSLVTLPFACLRGKAEGVRVCQDIASDIGRLWHALGGRYEEYRELHH